MGIIDRKQLRRRISLMLGVSKSIYWGPTRLLMSVGDGGDVMKKYLDFQFSDNFVTPTRDSWTYVMCSSCMIAGKLKKIFLSFSLYSNTSAFLNTEKQTSNITSLHGIRFLSLTWIVIGHTTVYYCIRLLGKFLVSDSFTSHKITELR